MQFSEHFNIPLSSLLCLQFLPRHILKGCRTDFSWCASLGECLTTSQHLCCGFCCCFSFVQVKHDLMSCNQWALLDVLQNSWVVYFSGYRSLGDDSRSYKKSVHLEQLWSGKHINLSICFVTVIKYNIQVQRFIDLSSCFSPTGK